MENPGVVHRWDTVKHLAHRCISCGNESPTLYSYRTNPFITHYMVVCTECSECGPVRLTMIGAIRGWNKCGNEYTKS